MRLISAVSGVQVPASPPHIKQSPWDSRAFLFVSTGKTSIGTYSSFAECNGYIESNPVTGVMINIEMAVKTIHTLRTRTCSSCSTVKRWLKPDSVSEVLNLQGCVEWLKKRWEYRLFPDLNQQGKGCYSHAVSR
jgi:hypothetical protein